MQMKSYTSYATLAAFVAAMACAGNTAKTEDTDQSGAARDTTTTDEQNPEGYRGMETDTTQVPPTGQTPTDTFLQNQGQGTPQDTAGYSGVERVDTTGQAGQTDTTGFGGDTTGVTGGQDTTGMPADTSGTTGVDTSTSNPSGLDTSGTSQSGDTTGYDQSQQGQDSTSR
jgi:hypothetical protein